MAIVQLVQVDPEINLCFQFLDLAEPVFPDDPNVPKVLDL